MRYLDNSILMLTLFVALCLLISPGFSGEEEEGGLAPALRDAYLVLAEDGILVVDKDLQKSKFQALPTPIKNDEKSHSFYHASFEPGAFLFFVQGEDMTSFHYGSKGWTVDKKEDFAPIQIQTLEDKKWTAVCKSGEGEKTVFNNWEGTEKDHKIIWTFRDSELAIGKAFGALQGAGVLGGRVVIRMAGAGGVVQVENNEWTYVQVLTVDGINYKLEQQQQYSDQYRITASREGHDDVIHEFSIDESYRQVFLQKIWPVSDEAAGLRLLLAAEKEVESKPYTDLLYSQDSGLKWDILFDKDWQGRRPKLWVNPSPQ